MVVTEILTIYGVLNTDDFPAWIVHRASRLGLRGGLVHVSDTVIEAIVTGPSTLIDAMEVGCSLGPTSVDVERITRSSVKLDDRSSGFIHRLEQQSP